MSKIFAFLLLFAFSYSLFTTNVFAQDATTGADARKPAAIKQKINIRQEKEENKVDNLKEKLKAFKDQKKATISARVSNNLNQINENRTTQMQKHLSNMSKILDRLEARVTDKTAITNARNTIATTSAAVTAQSQKDYTIQVTSEGRVKVDAKKQRDQLHADLLALRKTVIDAKQSVAKAIRIAKSGPKEATSSGRE